MRHIKWNSSSVILGWCAFFAAAISLFATASQVRSDSTAPDAATQPSSTQPAADAGPVLDPRIAADVKYCETRQLCQRSDIKGGAFTKHSFEDLAPDGVLIGFRLGLGYFFNTEVIKYVRPIYLTPRGQEMGKEFGNLDATERGVEITAPPGYAVGAVDIRGGGGLGAMTITYMKFNGTRLDPTDICSTPKIGGAKDGGGLLDGDGTPIVGICVRTDDPGNFLGLGLIFIKPTAMIDRH